MYKAHVFGTTTLYKEDASVDRLHPFGEFEMFDVEADTLAQLVQMKEKIGGRGPY